MNPHHPRKYVNPYRRAPFNRSTHDTAQRVGYLLDHGRAVLFVEFWNVHHTETFLRYFRNRSAWKAFLKNIGHGNARSHGIMRKAKPKS